MILRTIIFALLLFLIEFYFLNKTVKSVKTLFPNLTPFKKNIYNLILLFFFNIYPLFLIFVWTYSTITGASVLVPENTFFDYLVIYPFWIYIFIAVQCVLFFLLLDIIRFIFFPFYRKIKKKIYFYQSVIVAALIAVFVIYVPFRILYDYNHVQVRMIDYYSGDVPGKLDNLKIALISDVQADRYTDGKRLGNYISLVNEQSPDLVLIGGDVITSTPEFIDTAAEYLGKIKSKYGIYSCVGDHDNWAYRRDYARSLREVKSALFLKGIKMLDNKDTVLNIRGEKILITFITNTYVEHINKNELVHLTGNSQNYALKILLTHQPRQNVVTQAIKSGYDLFLAGHTHGGQVTFLFPVINLTPTLLETRYVRGNFHFGNMLMIVTRGLGMSLVPLRYNSTPEISIINIRKHKSS